MKHIIFLFLGLLFLGVSCGRDTVTNTNEIIIPVSDAYLPNIHWTQSQNNKYVEIDTLYVHPNEKNRIHIEIYFDKREDYHEICIDWIIDTIGYFSEIVTNVWDPVIERYDEKMIIAVQITAYPLGASEIQCTIFEDDNDSYNLRRFSTLPIVVTDSSIL